MSTIDQINTLVFYFRPSIGTLSLFICILNIVWANPVFVCGHAFPREKLNLNFPFIKRKQQVSVVMRGFVLCSAEASAYKLK